MQENPSYLSGIGEIEPHYFRPIVPPAIQSYVTNTPLDRGDGIRPVMLPQASAKRVNGLGSACIPCTALKNPIAYGAYGNWKEKVGSFISSVLTPEQQQNLKAGLFAETSARICANEKAPQFIKDLTCPELEIEDDQSAILKAPIGMYVLVGVAGVAATLLVTQVIIPAIRR